MMATSIFLMNIDSYVVTLSRMQVVHIIVGRVNGCAILGLNSMEINIILDMVPMVMLKQESFTFMNIQHAMPLMKMAFGRRT